jgi:hypothetical protein
MTQETPQQSAERQLEQEEEQRRQSRLSELTREEAQRREAQAREAEREARRAEASEKAAELSRRRLELEEQAEETMTAMTATLDELRSLDSEHRKALHAAGGVQGPGKYQDLDKALTQWVQGALLRNNPSTRARTLQEVDLLTGSEEPESRSPAPGLPGARVEDAPRLEADRLLSKLLQRAQQMFLQYGRPVSWNECVAESERDEVARILDDEQKAELRAALRGEAGR